MRSLSEMVIAQHRDYVFNRCASLVGDRESAKDLTQEILIKIFLKFENFKHDCSVSTWIYAVTSNHCFDFLRKKKFETIDYLTLLNKPYQNDLESDEEDKNSNFTEVFQQLNLLPEYERELIFEKYLENKTIEELCALYQLKPSALKMRLKRIKDKIRQQRV